MVSQKLSKITFWLLLESLFLKTGLFHGHHGPANLIVISFDGFRWDYLSGVKKFGLSTPHFDRLVDSGVSIRDDGVKNAFVTKTFPNHYSIATGLYEESHGIVGNSFFDPDFNETFYPLGPTDKDRKWWDGKSGKPTEPIWVTNEKCRCERKSGVVMWPGSDVEGQRPSHLVKFNGSTTLEEKVRTLVGWFHDDDPINFGMLYVNEPDATGHKFGPESKEVMDKIVELDGLLGRLLDELEEHEMLHGMNIIVTSDHGMVEGKGMIYLTDHVSPDTFQHFGNSPVLHLLPKPGREDEIYDKLKGVPNLDVYAKSKIPSRYHYQNNRRIMPLVVAGQEGFSVCAEKNKSMCSERKGDHGYDNSLPSMHPIFVAMGPAFRAKHRLEKAFEIVDIYLLMCTVLGLQANDNEGDFSRISELFPQKHKNPGEDIMLIGVILVVMAISIGFCVCVCINHCDYFVKKSSAIRSNSPKEGQKHLLASEEDDELV